MAAQVTIGFDDSEEAAAAAVWAAREAALRSVPLVLVHADEGGTPGSGQAPDRQYTERTQVLLRQAAQRARERHPGLQVRTEWVRGRADEVLTSVADASDVTVLGSRGLGGLLGFVVGSVPLAVVSAAARPVVLVRVSHEQVRPARTGIVAGLDLTHPCQEILGFAFDEAACTGLPLTLVHYWKPAPVYGAAAVMDPALSSDLADLLAERLAPWRRRYPEVAATGRSVAGSAAPLLVEAARHADLVVVGRRSSGRSARRIGHVAHAALHHSPAPVAVVPHL